MADLENESDVVQPWMPGQLQEKSQRTESGHVDTQQLWATRSPRQACSSKERILGVGV